MSREWFRRVFHGHEEPDMTKPGKKPQDLHLMVGEPVMEGEPIRETTLMVGEPEIEDYPPPRRRR